MTVAISLSIATAETFKVAKRQYELGSMNATELREEVVSGREIRIIRVISDTILWVAQVQTLVRLFPRHREKVIIKWAGFALIVLDTVFAILNNFVYQGRSRPRKYVDAIPALSYLFALALSLLYAAWVIYYSISKRRFAFYHPKMRNMALVAMLALASVLIPIIFFVIDICKPDVAGWGDYVRWVGAAAASVVVWEWVERIEALEREERKDGVLGREIFDGDEMLDLTPSEEVSWPLRRRGNDNGGPGGGGPSDGRVHFASSGTDAAAHRPPRPPAARGRGLFRRPMWSSTTAGPQVPPTSDTPISRTDTLSAGSTVYAVHYHPISESNTPIPEHEAGDEASSGLSGGWKTPDDVQRTNRSRSDV
ncbi:MAG: pH-response regulator protein palH/rim21 [Piccolia ochrophora]|nr:MAG: pH-response regulator protein palH/rim21 [Piccolia ochrophora]